MFKWLNNIGIRTRLVLSVALFMGTLLFAMYNAYCGLGANIDFAAKEKMGNYYQRPLARILSGAVALRMMESAPGADKTENLRQLTKQIDAGMHDLEKAQAAAGAALQFTDEGLSSRGRENLKYEKVAAKWKVFSQSMNNGGKADIGTLVSFIADIRGMISHSGDTSNLILDPDLDSYYLMDVTLLSLPQTVDRQGEIASSVYGALGKLSPMSIDDRIKFSTYAAILKESDFMRTVGDFDTSFKEDANFYGESPTYKSTIDPLLADYKRSNQALIDMLNDLAAGKAPVAQDFTKTAEGAFNASVKLLDASYDELDRMLDLRIDAYKSQQRHTLAVSLIGIAVSVAFFMIVAQSLISPLRALTGSMIDLTEQKLDITVPYDGARSEIGKIARAVKVFQGNAQNNARLEKEKPSLKRAASGNARI